MPKMHLRQPGLTYSDCGLKTNNKKIKEAGYSRYFYQNELDKGCFQHDMTYGELSVYLEKQLLIKYYLIKHLMLLKIQIFMDVSAYLLQ